MKALVYRRCVRMAVVAVALLAMGAATRAQDLGRIDFPTSGGQHAQAAFLKGVLLLHSFEYADAKEAFEEAQKLEPGFAMAYWGEAMTYNHAVWQQTAPDAARAALSRLAPTLEARLAKAPTDKEKDWLRSLEPLYGEGDKLARDTAYAAALQQMQDRYPDDLEVAAFHALAILGTSHQGRDFSIYMRAAAIVEQVYSKNPQHPGAAHYLIHAYDDPVHAPLGLRYADAYGKLAPGASHALHMPSHIYFALGMWNEAVTMNERSYKAADARVAEKKLGLDERGFHALLWVTYGYLQQGRYDAAKVVLDSLEADAATSGSVRTRSHLALARAAWLVETRRWADARRPGMSAEGLGTDAIAAGLFAQGLAAVRSGNRAGANDALQQMAFYIGDGDRPVASAPVPRMGTRAPAAAAAPSPVPSAAPADALHAGHGSAPQPSAGLPAAGGGGDKRVPAVMALQLEAAILFAEGRRDEAVIMARQAAVAEESLSFEFGPPVPVKPAYELLGEMLLDTRRAGDAQKAFAAALKRAPGRTLSLLGLMRAATAAKDVPAAQQAAATLRRNLAQADKTLPELREIAAIVPATSSNR